MPSTIPPPKPSRANTSFVPRRPSSQTPITPGKTISKETVMMREAHSAATAKGERFSGELATTGQVCKRPRRQPPGWLSPENSTE